MKTMIALLFATLSFTSQAALNQDDVLKALVGQWSVKMDSGDVKFLVRSNGDVQIISNAHREYVSAKLSFNSSTSDWGMDGLPVAHLILSEGSDEDVRDIHLLVTGLQDGDNVRVKKVAAFNTFNDGPNEFSDIENGSRFKRYNAQTKTWAEVK